MQFKLIMALVTDEYSEQVLRAARDAGATGSTIINNARGEGLRPHKTFLGLNLTGQCDILLFLVEASLAEKVLAAINETAGFDRKSGTGLAFQLNVEKAVGAEAQWRALMEGDRPKR
jgi:nitrogen regulatory protein PII